MGKKATGSDSNASTCRRRKFGNGCDHSSYQSLFARLGNTFAIS